MPIVILDLVKDYYQLSVITSTYHIFAPVLASCWSYLGEPGKLVPASSKRVRSVRGATTGLEVCLIGVERVRPSTLQR